MGTKLDRKDVKIFAENSDATLITEFRSESADGSTASFSRDPDVIQNANYEQGWVENQNNLNTKIFGEDMNAVSYVQSYLLKYLYENGIPEWSSNTEYFEHSIARIDNRLFISLTDNNINNDPTNTVGEWSEIPLSAINIATSGTGSSIFNTSSGNNITLKSLSVDGYASLQDNGDQINIHVIGGSGIVDAYWGQIQGTLTNQADLVAALGDKQDNLTFDSPLSVDVNNEVSISKATDSISGYLDSTDFQTFAGKQDALSGFTHAYTSGTDTAEIYPTATNSNIGTNTYPIGSVFANNVYSKNTVYTDTIEESTGDTVTINSKLSVTGNTSITGTVNITGTTSTDKIQGLTTATTLETGASIVPDVDNTYALGSGSTNSYSNVFTREVGAPNGTNNKVSFANTNGGDVTYDCGIGGTGTYGNHVFKIGQGDKVIFKPTDAEFDVNIVPKTNNSRSLGNSDYRFSEVCSESVGTKTITSTGGSATVRLGYASGYTQTSFSPAPGLTNCDLGTSSDKWNNVYASNFYGTYNPPSDRNKKDNIEERGTRKDAYSSLNAINNLKTYSYTFKDDTEKKTHIGIMAQELREVEPILVNNLAPKGSKQEDLYFDLTGYVTLLTEAVKELSGKVESLEARVAELEGKQEEKGLEK